MAEDFYNTLGISKEASDGEIKNAYRKMAMKYHPDRNQGDAKAEKKFKEVSNAYEILKDPQKKQAYDQYGHAAFEQGGMGGPGGFGQQGFGGFSDIFEDIFGMGGGGPKETRGDDLRYDIAVDLEEAFFGKNLESTISKMTACKENHSYKSCTTCDGYGKVRTQSGFFSMERTCGRCSGTGQEMKGRCGKCSNTGRVKENKKLKIKIPPGIETGNRIRMSGEGEAGELGGQNGDLYVFVKVNPNKIFERDKNNIICEVAIPFTTAALGGSIEVPTIEKKMVSINIPQGMQSGHKLRVKGKGMSILRTEQRGDMIVKVHAETPINLSAKQKKILTDLDSSLTKDNSKLSEGFFNKVKKMFN
ncbi:MAG: molecular chaperone DnaJ [Pelagibacteraceae bacterium]|nr:molecular chaperone DnaJ [Pelagibacteraceae bacterium]|tara:strand:- start:2661 stop:3740 length:1080 start_codon:yes stop_codon:yes gene_type:complete